MNLKIPLTIAGILLVCIFISAQTYNYKYFFDVQMSPATKEKAVILGRGIKTPAGVKTDFFLVRNNQLLATTEYTDSTLNVMNGANIEYYANGNKALHNNYKMNLLDGLSLKWDSLGNMTDSVIYQNDKQLFKSFRGYGPMGILFRQTDEDSVADTLRDKFYTIGGTLGKEAVFKGNKGVFISYNMDGGITTDSLFTRKEIVDASFPGGTEAWRRFLERNLDGDVPIRNGARSGQATAVVQFVVSTDGSISDIKALTNHGFGIEEEAIRVIKRSGKWIPATQYGRPVKAYRKQPITFSIQQAPPTPISAYPQTPSNF